VYPSVLNLSVLLVINHFLTEFDCLIVWDCLLILCRARIRISGQYSSRALCVHLYWIYDQGRFWYHSLKNNYISNLWSSIIFFVCLFPKGYVFEDISNVACLDFIDVPIIFRISCLWHVSRSVQNQVILFDLLSDFPRSISSRSNRSQILLFHLWLLFHHRNCILNATLTILDVPRCISIGIDICCYTVTIEFKLAVCYLLVWFTFGFSILVTGLNNHCDTMFTELLLHYSFIRFHWRFRVSVFCLLYGRRLLLSVSLTLLD
jgi:hypothetical protein